MPFYYFIITTIMLVLLLLYIRSFILKKENFPVELFNEALRDENSGNFEAALITYKSALSEAEKTMFLTGLKYKIASKLKVLHTILDYRKSLLFIRQN